MLYKIDLPIYPINIYIHIGTDINGTLNQFIDADTNLIINDSWDNCYGKVYRNLLKDKCQKTNSPNREKEEFYV